MKKFLSILLCLMLVLGLAACAAEPAGGNSTTTTSTTTTAADTEPTDPPVEDDPVEEVPTDIGEAGYCAVGIVDTAAKTAKVVGGNGAVQEITYTGEDPMVGIAYKFVKSGDVYELTLPTYFRPLEDVSRDFRTFDNTPAGAPDTLGWWDTRVENISQITLNEDTVVFMRYSATEWRVMTGSDVIAYSEYPLLAWVGIDGEVIEKTYVSEAETASIILVGQKNAQTGEIERIGEGYTFFFDEEGYGWSEGDIIIE